jgi:hypothetical protein
MADIDAQFSEYIGMLVRGFPRIPKDDIARVYNDTIQQVGGRGGNVYYLAYWDTIKKLEATVELERLNRHKK